MKKILFLFCMGFGLSLAASDNGKKRKEVPAEENPMQALRRKMQKKIDQHDLLRKDAEAEADDLHDENAQLRVQALQLRSENSSLQEVIDTQIDALRKQQREIDHSEKRNTEYLVTIEKLHETINKHHEAVQVKDQAITLLKQKNMQLLLKLSQQSSITANALMTAQTLLYNQQPAPSASNPPTAPLATSPTIPEEKPLDEEVLAMYA